MNGDTGNERKCAIVASTHPNGASTNLGNSRASCFCLRGFKTKLSRRIPSISRSRILAFGVALLAMTLASGVAHAQIGSSGYDFDYDRDGDRDYDDLAIFELCMAGPGVAHILGCEPGDPDGDGVTDLRAFAQFQIEFSLDPEGNIFEKL